MAGLQDILRETRAKICLVKDGGLAVTLLNAPTSLVYSEHPPLQLHRMERRNAEIACGEDDVYT